MIIPISTDTQIRRTPWANYVLIGLNVLVFLVVGGADRHAIDGRQTIGDRLALVGDHIQLYQFFTYQFMHANWMHIGGNMLFLWIFGNAVNGKMGHAPYVLFYLAGGIAAAVGHAYINPDFGGMVGASGAIAAVTTAYLALFPRSYVTVLYWWFIIGTFELPSMVLIVFKMILWDNVLAKSLAGESNVAFDAHLAGYGFGFVATSALLAIKALPRDQFDIVALWRRWFHRQAFRSAMADPDAEARARYGRVARPVSLQDLPVGSGASGPRDQVAELRMRIAEALALNDRNTAAELYEKLLEHDPRQVLPKGSQLDVANQLYTLNKLPQAAAAYEKLLSAYPTCAEAGEIRLLLGIIYARDLRQYEVAEGHLRQALVQFADEKRREQCRHWLAVAADGLGRNEE
ncbi:MAG TPA: rhomboid family intramembrane serine protease [Phycisphaerae bacterium]|nr:rhomboid family intramembrane serine protease [Phycisphaerae bacterium]HRR87333.1 rhomboid family intramembrane serine protease [Phycisphaerae bacterium]